MLLFVILKLTHMTNLGWWWILGGIFGTVAPMGLINALIVAIGARDREHTFQTFRELEEIWSEYGVYQTLEH